MRHQSLFLSHPQVEYPLTEEKIHLGPPHQSNFGYAHGKRLVDVQNHAYNSEFGDKFTSVIPTNVFGPWDNYVSLLFRSKAAFIDNSFRTWRTRTSYPVLSTNVYWPNVSLPRLPHPDPVLAENNTPFIVSGTGKPLRQFIYSRDLAKLFVWSLREYNDIEPVILSPSENEEVSIKQVADAIVKAVGFGGQYTVSQAI